MVESQKLPEYNMDTMPLRRGHILILMIASAGQFFGGALAILVGRSLDRHDPSSWIISLVAGVYLCLRIDRYNAGVFVFRAVQ